MSKLPFRYPDIERLFMGSFASAVGNNAKALREQYMAPENVLKFTHGKTWEAPANELGDKVGTVTRHGTETELKLADVVAGKIERIFMDVDTVTNQMHSQMERMLFDTMRQATDKTGQVVDGRNKTLPEAMYETVEMLELPLSDDGELSMPTMFIHPSQSKELEEQIAKIDPQFDERFAELKLRKKNEAEVREKARLARFERRKIE